MIANEQQKAELKKQQKLSSENTLIFYCSVDLDAIDMIALKQELSSVFKDYSDTKEIKFKLVLLQSPPLSSNDYLVKKRLPLCLLTISAHDKDRDSR